MAKPDQKRYFIAIIPPEPLFSRVEDLKKEMMHKYHTKAALRSPAHITLHMPFLWSETKEKRLFNILAQTTTCLSFPIKLNGFGAFPPRTLYVRPEENPSLHQLYACITRQTREKLNLFHAEHKNGFHPHMTVAFRDLKKPEFFLAWEEFKDKPFEDTFRAEGFWLLKHTGKFWVAYQYFAFARPESDGAR